MPNPSASDKSTFAIVFDGLSERNFTGSAHWDTAFKEMHDCGREVADFLSTTSALNLQLDADELGEHAVRRRSGGIWRKAMRLAVDCRILLALLVALVGLVPSSAWSEDRGASFGRAVSTFRVNPTIYSISWSPNQRHLAVVYGALGGTRLGLFDISRGKSEWEISHVPGGGTISSRVAFVADGRVLVAKALPFRMEGATCTGCSWIVSVIDAGSGRSLQNVDGPAVVGPGVNRTEDLALSRDARVLATLPGANRSKSSIGYNVGTWTPVWEVGPVTGAIPPQALLFDSDRARVLFAVNDFDSGASIQTWSIRGNSRIASFQTYKAFQRQMVLGPSGHIITGGGGQIINGRQNDFTNAVHRWDAERGTLVATYSGPGGGVNSLSVTADGRFIAAAKGRVVLPGVGIAAHVVMWDAQSGKQVAASSYGQGFPNVVSFSPDGRFLAIGADDAVQVIELDKSLIR